MKIYKQTFETIDSVISLTLSLDMKISGVHMQDGKVAFWHTVPSEGDPLLWEGERKFRLVGTGHEFSPHVTIHGTVMDGPFVWHLIEEWE